MPKWHEPSSPKAFNPLSRGESKTPQTPNCQIEKHYPILPSREGQGVCDAQAKPLKNQSNHQKPTNATSPNSSKTISSQSASLTITHPSIPSQEGKSHTTNHSLPRRNKHQSRISLIKQNSLPVSLDIIHQYRQYIIYISQYLIILKAEDFKTQTF